MDEIVKQSIEARRNAFDTSYEIKDENLKKEIEVLFEKMNKLGEEAKDAMDFETKFASSPLNTEYTNLFTKIASCSKPIIHESAPDHHIKSDKEYVKEEIESDVKYVLEDLSMPARRKAREAFDSKMRDTPLGKIEQASNTLGVFKRIFKK